MRRVPWTEGQRALVLAEWPDYQPRWCEAVSTVRAGRRYWQAALGPSSLMVEATTAATRHLPGQCRTCHGFGCGCPGEGTTERDRLLDLLLDCWTQFAIPGPGEGEYLDAGLSTLEELHSVLMAAGLVDERGRVVERPRDKDEACPRAAR